MVDARSRTSQNSLSLHTANGDKLYRWAMWRMYINEDMSCKISDWRDLGDRSATVTSVARPYLKHPDCRKYGKLMRRKFGHDMDTVHYRNRLKLSDGQYLVYGIPRVSLNKYVPTEIQKLKQSCPDIPSTFANIGENGFENLDEAPSDNEISLAEMDDNRRTSIKDETEQITELFKFVSFENTPNTSPRESTSDTTDAPISHQVSSNQPQNDITSIDNVANDAVDKERLVTRSKVFWKKLAQRRHDIIELGKENPIPSPPPLPDKSHDTHVISSDILLKQQKLLKATPKPTPHKDMWRSLAERKTEILKMSDNVKQKENKSNQLWNFIASKKNDLLHIKRGVKNYSDVAGLKHDNHKSGTVLNNDSGFQDPFQRELEEKLRRYRLRKQIDQEQSKLWIIYQYPLNSS